MNKAQSVVDRLIEADLHSDTERKVLAGLTDLEAKAKESTRQFGGVKTAVQRTLAQHPDKAKAGEIHGQLDKLEGSYQKRNELLATARYAAAYRSALHKVGLRPTDVVARFGGESRQVRLGNNRRGKFITAVETRDGRRVSIEPVEIPLMK